MSTNADTVEFDSGYYDHISSVGTAWLSDFAYHGTLHGKYGPRLMDKSLCDKIAKFMDAKGIGKSEYGALMDAIGREKGVFMHRLYGHHLVYDFPIKEPDKIVDFLAHEFSDLFTKNGLPIIPGEMLENAPAWLKKLTIANEPCKSWNFINGFDLLAGTVSIFTASRDLRAAIKNEMSIDTLGDFAQTFGVGVLELAIAISMANPLLFVGSLLELTAGVRAIFNDGDVIYMQRQQRGLTLEFSLEVNSLEAALEALSRDASMQKISIDTSLNEATRFSFE